MADSRLRSAHCDLLIYDTKGTEECSNQYVHSYNKKLGTHTNLMTCMYDASCIYPSRAEALYVFFNRELAGIVLATSASFLAELSVRSPRKLIIFMI